MCLKRNQNGCRDLPDIQQAMPGARSGIQICQTQSRTRTGGEEAKGTTELASSADKNGVSAGAARGFQTSKSSEDGSAVNAATGFEQQHISPELLGEGLFSEDC